MKTISTNNLLKTSIFIVLFIAASAARSQSYFTHVYGSTSKDDYCRAGVQLSNGGMISVGNTPGSGLVSDLYFLSVDNNGGVITATGCTTNGNYSTLFSGSSVPSQANDVAELDPSGLVAITGYVYHNSSNKSLLVMVIDYTGVIQCVNSYDLGAGVADVIGNAIIVNGSDIYITGKVSYIPGGGSSSSGNDLIALKLSYSTSGGTPTLNFGWSDILDITAVGLFGITANTYDEEGLDVMYNTSGAFNYGRLLVVGTATDVKTPGTMKGLALEINEGSGAFTGSPSLDILYAPGSSIPQSFKSVNYDYAGGTSSVFIGGQSSTVNTGQDYTLTNVANSGTGTINWSNFYDSGSNLDDYFSSMIFQSQNPTSTQFPRLYLTGYAPVGSGGDNDILLFELDKTGAFVTTCGGCGSPPTGASHYGNAGDEKGNDISEDIAGKYLTLHSTTSGSYTTFSSTSDFDLVNIYYNGITKCDFNTLNPASNSAATSVDHPGFSNSGSLSSYNITNNCNTYSHYTVCHNATVSGGSNNLLGVNEISKTNLKYYPSILNDDNTVQIELKLKDVIGNCKVEVIDGLGRVIKTLDFKTDNKFQFCLGDNLSKGMYFVKINVNSESFMFKVVK